MSVFILRVFALESHRALGLRPLNQVSPTPGTAFPLGQHHVGWERRDPEPGGVASCKEAVRAWALDQTGSWTPTPPSAGHLSELSVLIYEMGQTQHLHEIVVRMACDVCNVRKTLSGTR